jgi:amino acid transporter
MTTPTLDEPPPKGSQSKTVLKRSMKMFGALLITLSAVTPASSVFIIAPVVVKQAGAGAMLSFVIAGVIGLFIAFIYAELSSAFPHAGGEYAIVNRVLGPFWGFVIMGVTLTSYILMSAVISLGVANFLTPLFPGLTPFTGAVATVIVATALSLLNIKTNAFITGSFLAIELLALVAVAGLGFANINRPLSELFLTPVHLNDAGALEPVSLGVIGLATSVAIFAYSGYSGAIYLSEETHDAPRHIARAILWALAVTIIAEAVPMAAILLGAPDMKALLSSSNLMGDFIAGLGGSGLNTVISLGITLAIVNAVIAFMIMDARLVYATARDQTWLRGLNHALTRIDQRFGSPHIATLACGAATLLACFVDETLLTGDHRGEPFGHLRSHVRRRHCWTPQGLDEPRRLPDALVSVCPAHGSGGHGMRGLRQSARRENGPAEPSRNHRHDGCFGVVLRPHPPAQRGLGTA